MRFVVSGKSMEPKFYDGDKLLVSEKFYKLRKPHVGDAVVIKDPRDKRLILKRIESIEGKKYFMRGDNIEWSTDSRAFGTITQKSIVGKVILRYSRSNRN